jgi:hypothetical protein
MDAHDGSYRLVGDVWHYYAMEYGLCIENNRSAAGDKCGTQTNNSVNLWTSPDLATWTLVAKVGCAQPCAPSLLFHSFFTLLFLHSDRGRGGTCSSPTFSFVFLRFLCSDRVWCGRAAVRE